MNNTIGQFLEGLEVGPGATADAITVFPLFNPASGGPPYELLDDAIAAGHAAVEEKGPGGSVPALVLINKSETFVLITDGDELIGGMQNRILNITVLVPPKAVVDLPVSCVERGRWARRSRQFATGDKAFYKLRHALQRHTTSSLKSRGDHRSDQSDVWRHVDEGLLQSSTESPTAAMQDAYTQQRKRLETVGDRVPYVEGASGLVCASHDRIAFAEVFNTPEACKKVWPRAVRSFLFGGRVIGTAGSPTPIDAASEFLDAARTADAEQFPSAGAGIDIRLESGQVRGSAIVLGDHVVHCVLFSEDRLV